MQDTADRLAQLLVDKGYEKVSVTIQVRAFDADLDHITIRFELEGKQTSEYFFGSSPDPIARAEAYIDKQPTADGIRQRTAFEMLSKALERARNAGIDFDFNLNSENLLEVSGEH